MRSAAPSVLILALLGILSACDLSEVEVPVGEPIVVVQGVMRPDLPEQFGGRQFVVVAAGGHWSGGSPPGDYIIAFALPDQP